MSRLGINVGAVGTACILHIPCSIAIPHACMFAGDKVIGKKYRTGGPTSNGCSGSQVKARAWQEIARAAIDDDEMTDDRWCFVVGFGAPGGCFTQIACNGDDYLH